MLFGWPFPPRGESYLWEPRLIILQVVTNGIIAVSFLYIAWRLITLVRRAPDMTFSPALTMLFAILMAVSGVSHGLDVVMIWYGIYWTDGLLRVVVAVLAVLTLLRLRPFVPITKAAPVIVAEGATEESARRDVFVNLWKGLATNLAADLETLKARREADIELRELRAAAQETRAVAREARAVAQEARAVAGDAKRAAESDTATETLGVSEQTLVVAQETRDIATETRDEVKKNGRS